MKLLVNNKEYSEFLVHEYSKLKVKEQIRVDSPAWKKTFKLFHELKKMLNPDILPGLTLRPTTKKSQQIIQQAIENIAYQDLDKWYKQQLNNINKSGIQDSRNFFKYVNKNFNRFTDTEREYVVNRFNRSSYKTMTKIIGCAWPNSEYISRDLVNHYTPDKIFIRNTVDNEELLRTRMSNNLPFLFMDSGYTNFLESGKVWHRLCNNHIHNNQFNGKFNHKRLTIFKCLPEPWRQDGNDVIIIEPSAIQCKLFDIDIEQWRYWVQRTVEQHLVDSKRIVFREKVDKKIRQSFYQYLLNEDVYCVINYNSNAAVEAIWAGVPVITLGKHITNPVTIDSIDQINNLKRPDIDFWLKRLSYSQYTLEEIESGIAKEILERHFNV